MTGEKENKHTFTFKITELKKLMFYENDPNDVCYDFDQNKKVKTEVNTKIHFDINKEQISIILDINTINDDKSHAKLFGIKTSTSYHVKNLKSIIKQEKDKVFDIPKPFMASLISIAYSNTRGMLSVLITNKNYSSFILPLVDPNNLIPKSNV